MSMTTNHPPHRRLPVGRIVLVVLGCVFVPLALALLGGGTVLTWAHQTQRDASGYFTSPSERLETLDYAIVSERVDLDLDSGDYLGVGQLGTVRIRLDSTNERQVFIGIGPRRAVKDYLRGVARAEIADVSTDPFSVEYRHLGDGAPTGPPGDESFWQAQAEGSGPQTLTWPVESGDWVVVVMNRDATAGVGVDAAVGFKADWIRPLGIGLLVAGGLALIIAVAALVVGIVGLRHHAASDETGGTHVHTGSGPVRLTGRLDPELSRWLWLVKWFLVIPHLVILAFLWLAFAVLTVVAFFAILLTGRYPRGIFDFNAGVLRWSWRVSYYAFGVAGTDRYPPFSLGEHPDYPARLDIAPPDQLSRGLVLVKWWLLAIPHYLIVGLMVGTTVSSRSGDRWVDVPVTGLVSWLVLVAVVTLLFTGRYPSGIHRLVVGLHRWVFRVVAYAALMTDEYPPFRLDQGDEEPSVDSEPGAPPS